MEAGHARSAARHLRLVRSEEAGDFAQLSACGADDGGSFVEALSGFAGSEGETGLLFCTTDGTECVTRAR